MQNLAVPCLVHLAILKSSARTLQTLKLRLDLCNIPGRPTSLWFRNECRIDALHVPRQYLLRAPFSQKGLPDLHFPIQALALPGDAAAGCSQRTIRHMQKSDALLWYVAAFESGTLDCAPSKFRSGAERPLRGACGLGCNVLTVVLPYHSCTISPILHTVKHLHRCLVAMNTKFVA